MRRSSFPTSTPKSLAEAHGLTVETSGARKYPEALTHTLTHNRKSLCGTDGAKDTTGLPILRQKGPETHVRNRIYSFSHIRNQQVAGSSPATSSTPPRTVYRPRRHFFAKMPLFTHFFRWFSPNRGPAKRSWFGLTTIFLGKIFTQDPHLTHTGNKLLSGSGTKESRPEYLGGFHTHRFHAGRS